MKYEDLAKANESIKTTSIKGKNYAEVNQRIKAFRMVYPEGYIKTELIDNSNGVCVFRAECGYTHISGEDSCPSVERITLGVGHAYEKEGSSFINKTSYIENCETSAVGRALGMAGFGIDTAVASVDEVQTAIANQGEKDGGKKANVESNRITEKEQEVLRRLCEGKGYDVKEIFPKGLNLTVAQYSESVLRLSDLPAKNNVQS